MSNFHTAARAGVKKAAEAISTMSASTVRLDVISAGVAPTSRLSEIAGNPEDLVAGVYISVTGDIPGHALLVVPYESALHLVDMVILGKASVPPNGWTRWNARSTRKWQHSHLLYLTALSDFYQCSMPPSPPSVAIDMGAAVIDSVLLNTGRFDDETISIVTRFAGPRRTVRGFFLYIPEIATSY